ncbi:MAG TPA: hypothetical protein VIL99_16825 [Ignavibacteria bacterium]
MNIEESDNNFYNHDDTVLIFPKAKKCYVYLESDEINGLSILAKLIILTLGNNDDIKIIYDISKLSSLIIKDEFEYLYKCQLLQFNQNCNYELTELGRNKYDILHNIIQFNMDNINVAVDMSLGHIMDEKYLKTVENEVLSQEIINQILYNANILNLQEFICSNYNIFNLEDFENEKFTAYLKPDGKEYMLKLNIDLPSINNLKPTGFNLYGDVINKKYDNDDTLEYSNFSIKINLVIFNFNLKNIELKSISNNVINLLAQLSKNNDEYISEEGHRILKLLNGQSVINNRLDNIKFAFNCADGELSIINNDIFPDNKIWSNEKWVEKINIRFNNENNSKDWSNDKWIVKINNRFDERNLFLINNEVKMKITNKILETDFNLQDWDIELININKIFYNICISSNYIKENGKYIND